ncbi:Glucan endo-1,3-beta-glucosidase 9-like protein [Drosera capensis]
MLETLNSSLKAAESWVHDNVTRYVSGGGGGGVARIDWGAPFLHGYGGRFAPFVIGAVINIQKALIKANLTEEVKVVFHAVTMPFCQNPACHRKAISDLI